MNSIQIPSAVSVAKTITMASGMSSRPRRLRLTVRCGETTQASSSARLRLRLEREVEEVAEDGDHADERIERDVRQHVKLDHRGRAQVSRHAQRVDGDEPAREVTESGHEPEQRIEAEPPLRARNGERAVEELRDQAKPFEVPAAAFLVRIHRTSYRPAPPAPR
jgi:hypothetical protein